MEKVQSYDVVVVGGGAAGIAAAVGAAQAGAPVCWWNAMEAWAGRPPMPTWPPTAVSLPTAILPNKL